jgi:nitrite reductase/ring-hydroxylating ferredoxin subunit
MEGQRDEEFTRIGTAFEVPEGEIRAYETRGTRIAVAHLGTRFAAFGDECTHAGCQLSEGTLDRDDTVVCPEDGSAFDLTTGEPVQGPAEDPVPVYAVRVADGWLDVGL